MNRSDKLAFALALVIALVGLGHFVLAHHGSLYDDAYIYLRYVENLRAGNGIRFNADDPPVEGFSSPLFLGLLTLGSFLTNDLELVSLVVSSGLLFVGIVASFFVPLTLLSDPRARAASLIGLALVLGDPFLLLNSVVGLDAPIFLVTFTLLALSVLRREAKLISLFAVLCFLARFEGVLCLALLPLARVERSRRHLFALAASVLFIVLGRLALFGEFAPNTYFAKSGGTLRHAELGLEYIATCVRDFPLAFFAPLALVTRARKELPYLLAIALGLVGSFLRSGGDLFPYSRFLAPLVPALSALALAGIAEGARLLARRFGRSFRFDLTALALVTLLVFARNSATRRIAESHGHENVLRWKAVGLYLRAHEPHTYVATVPIGAIGYFSGLRILDLVGLTEPAIAKSESGIPAEQLGRLWIGHERHFTPWVLDQKPDLVVTTKFRAQPWTKEDAKAGFIADVELLRLAKTGAIPYAITSIEIRPHLFVLALRRTRVDPTPDGE